MKTFTKLIAAVAVLGALAACKPDQGTSADTQQAAQMEQLAAAANRTVGAPGISNFFEKEMVRTIYEIRDDPTYRTYAYWTTMTGQYVFICDSVGFGLNASIQFSNPERVVRNSGSIDGVYGTLPQPEPNGLFMPEGLAATYVLCVDPKTTEEGQTPDLVAVYVEQDVYVSPFPIPTAINPYEE